MSPLHDRSMLVTGAGGFIGSHLVEHLVAEGARVRAFCRYNGRNDRGALEWLAPEILSEVDVVLGDVRDVESVSEALRDIDTVFHLAAQIAVPYSFANPRDFFETNVLGSLNVAQIARARETNRVVHVSTSEVYGSAQTVPIAEDHPLEPRSPYAASKLAAEKLMTSFYHSYALPAVVVRPFNTYGPRQSARAFIPTVVSHALESSTVRLGALHPTRDLLYVADTVRGLTAAASAPEVAGRVIALGTGRETAVGDVVKRVGDLVGRELVVEQDPQRLRPEGSEVDRLVCDPQLARTALDWRSEVDLDDGLQRTIAWISANSRRFRTGEYVV
jgi:dTDP-glucose 4,6-dehydratase